MQLEMQHDVGAHLGERGRDVAAREVGLELLAVVLDAEDLIAMQKESKAATTPPPTTTTTTTPGSGKTKRKVGAFKLATRS